MQARREMSPLSYAGHACSHCYGPRTYAPSWGVCLENLSLLTIWRSHYLQSQHRYMMSGLQRSLWTDGYMWQTLYWYIYNVSCSFRYRNEASAFQRWPRDRGA